MAKRAPEAHIPTGHYVMFEKEDQTLKGNPGFNRYCYFARINFKPGNGYLDETLEIPLTKGNSYIGQVIYVSNFSRVENFAIFGKLVFVTSKILIIPNTFENLLQKVSKNLFLQKFIISVSFCILGMY